MSRKTIAEREADRICARDAHPTDKRVVVAAINRALAAERRRIRKALIKEANEGAGWSNDIYYAALAAVRAPRRTPRQVRAMTGGGERR